MNLKLVFRGKNEFPIRLSPLHPASLSVCTRLCVRVRLSGYTSAEHSDRERYLLHLWEVWTLFTYVCFISQLKSLGIEWQMLLSLCLCLILCEMLTTPFFTFSVLFQNEGSLISLQDGYCRTGGRAVHRNDSWAQHCARLCVQGTKLQQSVRFFRVKSFTFP